MNTAPDALLWRLFEELNFFHAAQVEYGIKKPGEGVTVVDDMMKTMKELGKTSTPFPVSLLQAIFDFLSTVQNGQLKLLERSQLSRSAVRRLLGLRDVDQLFMVLRSAMMRIKPGVENGQSILTRPA